MDDDVTQPARARGEEQPPAAGPAAAAPGRRVVEPDLLWVESITDRLLRHPEPPTWERAPIGEDLDRAQHAEPGRSPEPEPESEPGGRVVPLPVRQPRESERPLSYAEVLEGRPRPAGPPPPAPYFAPDPASSPEPPAPEGAMPAGVLRAALRDALPDDVGRAARPSPADAIFGDPSWSEPPEEPPLDESPEPTPEPTSKPPPEPPPAAELPAPEPPPEPSASEPVDEPVTGRHRNPAGADHDVTAIRMALRSGDEELAAAVLGLVADRGRERERVRMVEAYLDAVIAEGDDGLAGAARLRRLLGE